MPTPVLSARGRYGSAKKSGDSVAIEDASRDLAAAKLEQYIERVVSEAPALTPDQRSRLAALFVGGGA